MSNIVMSEYLYTTLPEVYRVEDALKDDILKRFLSTSDTSWDFISSNIAKIEELVNTDKCPTEYLAFLSGNLGFEYDPSIDDQLFRRLLSIIVKLYRCKGSKRMIKYLGREIVGCEPNITERYTTNFYTWTPARFDQWVVIKSQFAVESTSCFLLVSDVSTNEDGAQFFYDKNQNRLYMKNGLSEVTPAIGMIPGSSHRIETENASLDCKGSSVKINADSIEITWRVKFKSTMTNGHYKYFTKSDSSEWEEIGQSYLNPLPVVGRVSKEYRPSKTFVPPLTGRTSRMYYCNVGFDMTVDFAISSTDSIYATYEIRIAAFERIVKRFLGVGKNVKVTVSLA